jgi:RNA polymerase sigma factor (sigma-70 family)
MSPRIPIRLLAAQSDQRLLALAREGHERAFEALVARYRRPLLRYCRRSMRLSDARSEDVLQHALLQAWLALEGGTLVRDVKPWLYRIVHNAAVNAMRSSAENVTELTDAMHARMAGANESDLDRRIAVHDALSDVAALPPMQRQAIFLTAFDGQTHDEVASALGISHGAVRGLLYRARATLRSAAAAITPQWLIHWASGGAGATASSTERLAELSGSGGAIGMTGVLAKGAAVALTAGALVTGAAVVHEHAHAPEGSTKRTSTLARSAGATGRTGTVAESGAAAGASAVSIAADPAAQGTTGVRDSARAPAPAARRKTARAHRILAALPVSPGTLVDTNPAPRHGDAQAGGGGTGDVTGAADSGSSSATHARGGQGSPSESNRGSDSSGGGGAGENTGGGGGGSDSSSGHEAEPAPGGGQGEATEAVGAKIRSGDDHVAATSVPASKSDS